MSFVAGYKTLTPQFRYSKEDLLKAGESWLKENDSERTLYQRFIESCMIDQRAFAIPMQELLSLGGFKDRAEIFLREGEKLGSALLQELFKGSDIAPSSIDTLILTSCSIPLIPSLDAKLIDAENVGLSRTVRRIPVYQFGCAGGVAGLALANSLAASGQEVLLLSVELCSLVHHSNDFSRSSILGAALFADGAAAVIVSPYSGKLSILDTRSVLLKNSQQLMGYDLLDDGTYLKLERELPSRLMNEVPAILDAFLQDNALTRDKIQWWLFHPGGAKILSALEEILVSKPDSARWAWEVLKNNGNISSASVLFVMQRFLDEKVYRSGDKVVMLGIGPGLSIECALFECR